MALPRFAVILLAGTALWAQPSLLLNSEDLARIDRLASSQPWAASARAGIIQAAEAWPQSHLTKFGLPSLALPPEGGQWTHHYVCPTSGVRLEFRPPSTHYCPTDQRNYSGWPYDQVIFTNRHNDLADMARDLALAYHFTGRREYADRSAWILVQYSQKYLAYSVKDTQNRSSRSAGRITAQTLDDSIWLLAIAWAYDLIRDADVLTPEDSRRIQDQLLRPAAQLIRGNDMGTSNWQSWHNAALLSAGLVLADQPLIDLALNGPSGFRFQMRQSVLPDGFWLEGAWSYHFYALDALVRTAEMAARHGIDLWATEPNLLTLFAAPLQLVFADGSLPAFNDSGSVNLYTQDGLYEAAYARTADPALLNVLGRRNRGRSALLWGPDSLPPGQSRNLSSVLFENAGYAVLRAPASDHTVMLKFGPHGGGHGHYDKLGIVSYALAGPLAIDPGTQAYTAPSHNTWDITTVAHNTLVVDELRQNEATGRLLWSQFGDGYSAVSADAGPAYRNANLRRTLVHTADYTLDLAEAESTDGQPHRFDWVYHNNGTPVTNLPLVSDWSGFGRANGYQHLTGNRAAVSSEDWQLTFDGTSTAPSSYGAVFNSTTSVRGRWQLTRQTAFSGRSSAVASYEFNGPGYILLTSPVIPDLPPSPPSGLRLMVYGDGSGHRLSLRLHDSTDERFVLSAGPVNWTGWREISVAAPETGSHFGGNNDGIFDGPARNFALVIDQSPTGPRSGQLFIDDVQVLYSNSEPALAADFEFFVRHLRVSMLAAPDSTIVTGQGLGPDLRQPVPYLLARRTATKTRFVALLQPIAEEPTITGFQQLAPDLYEVVGPGWTDRIQLLSTGLDFRRSSR